MKSINKLSQLRSSLGGLRRRGVGLIEASLFVVISLGLIAGGIVFFQQTSEATRVNDAVQSIVSIQSGVRSLYVSEASFGASGANLIEAAVASGAVTSNMVQSDGSVRNQWGGAVTITGHPNTFVVDYEDVPQSACVRLAPHSSAGTGPAGNGIASIAINGVLVDEDGDGNVSPTEAEIACALSLETAQPLRMKWAFLADANMKTSAWEVETALGIDPEETGRENEVETRACGAGFLGNESRSRDHVSLSDGTTAPTDWSEWDRSNCEAIVEKSRRSETENGTCPTGLLGTATRTRDIITMTDGEERVGEWSEWNTAACAVGEVSRRTESQDGSCPTGLLGTATRTREVVVMSDGTEQPQAWSGWNNSACAVGEVSRRTESQDGSCPTGLLGTAKRTRDVVIMSDGTEQPQAWSDWNNAGCAVGEVSRRTETQDGTCPAGLVGKSTRTREVVVMSDGTEQPQTWSSWNNSQCLVVKTSERTESQNGTCPTGTVGTATRTRIVWVMSDGTEQPQTWSSWNNSQCLVVKTSERTESQNGTCPTGTVGTATRTRIVWVMSDGTEQPQTWSGWNNAQCLVVKTSERTETGSQACPAGYLGNQTRTRTVWVMSNGTEQPQAWSGWNTSACYIGEVSRYTQTENAACPSGYTGQQSRTRTVLRMSNGTEQPQSWSGWNTSSCQQANVIVETRTYRSQELIACGTNGRAVRSWNETRDRYTQGQITSRGRAHAGDSGCVEAYGSTKSGVTIQFRAYSDCGAFGQQQFTVQQWIGVGSQAWTHQSNPSSGGCGYY